MALMSGRLIGLNKCPGFRTVGIGDTGRQLMAKCVLLVMGAEAKDAFRTEQLCGGLEEDIEGGGGFHKVQLLLKQYAQEEVWGFLLIYA